MGRVPHRGAFPGAFPQLIVAAVPTGVPGAMLVT